MSKVHKITVSNFKAIAEQTATFEGCTAILIGGNNKGKSSFLRGFPDRVHGIKPEVIVKVGEKEGYCEWQLTTGEKFVWSFDTGEGKKQPGEKLTFITKDNIKGSLTRELSLKYFPPVFDVDSFLNAQPKKQKEMLQKLVGLDFTDVEARYDAAYLDREGKNRRAYEEKVVYEKLEMPEEVQAVDLTKLLEEKEKLRAALNKKYLENKKHNEDLRKEWETNNDAERSRVELVQKNRTEAIKIHANAIEAAKTLMSLGYKEASLDTFLKKLEKEIPASETYSPGPEPAYVKEMPDDSALKELDDKLANAAKINQKAQAYADFKKQEQLMYDTKVVAEEADRAVKAIEREKMDMIKSAKMPDGFSFELQGDGILYNNLPFTREQLSSSGIYIAALKLAAMTLGEVRTLHFDASFLDKKSLSAIEHWAATEDLQLLIERPDFEGGDITYELRCPAETKGGKP